MKEDLESYFRKKLNEPQESDGWNVPSDVVWEKAKPHFQKTKKKRRYGFWWFGASILFVIFIVGISSYSATKPMSATNNNQEIVSQTLSSKTDLAEKNNLTSIKKEEVIKNNINRKEAVPADYTENLSFQKQKSESTNSSSPFQKVFKTVQLYSSNQLVKKARVLRKKVQQANTLKEHKLVALLDFLPIKHFSLSVKEEPIYGAKRSKLLNKKGRGWSVDIHYSPTISKLSFESNFNNEKLVSGYGKTYFSNNFGLGISKNIFNNWSLYSGLNYLKVKNQSETQTNSIYNASTEISAGNVMLNKLSFPAKSPMGDIKLRAIMSHPVGMNIPTGDIIEGDFELTQKAIYLNVPIGIKYSKNITTQVDWFITSGLDFNFLLVQSNKFKGKMSHNNDQMDINQMSKTTQKTSAMLPINAHVSIGLDKRILSNFSLFTEVKYTHGLTKFAKSQNFQSTYKGINANIGIKMNF